MKIPFGTEVGLDLSPGHIVLDGDPTPPPLARKGHSSPRLSAHVSIVACSVAHLSYC